MFGYVLLGCCAYIFYRLGEIEYGRGGLLATISVILALASPLLIPIRVPFIPVVLSQVFLFVVLWVYNCFRKKPLD
jgi:predicted histidine transporter YuiF (NhaC family)